MDVCKFYIHGLTTCSIVFCVYILFYVMHTFHTSETDCNRCETYIVFRECNTMYYYSLSSYSLSKLNEFLETCYGSSCTNTNTYIQYVKVIYCN